MANFAEKDHKFLLDCFTCNRAVLEIDFNIAATKTGMTLGRNW